MQPTYCFYGASLPSFSTQREKETFYMALVYQIDRIISGGIHTFNTCMLPGVDLLSASHIAGLINTYNSLQRKENATPPSCGYLRLHLFQPALPAHLTVEMAKMTGEILKAVSSILHPSAALETDCVKRAIRSSTHMFAVRPEGVEPEPVSYAEASGLHVIRFTPDELIRAFKQPTG